MMYPIMLCAVLAVPSLLAAAFHRAVWTRLLWESITPARLALGAAILLATMVLAAQPARFVPGGGILAILLLALPPAYLQMLRLIRTPRPSTGITHQTHQ